MSQIDPNLVQQIAQQVLAALKARAADVGIGASNPDPVQVRPPIGTCTGDYSKYPELAGKMKSSREATSHQVIQPSSNEEAAATSADGLASPLPLTGIITARQLEEAVTTFPDGIARIAETARLTPLANDWARTHPTRLMRVAVSAVAGHSQSSGASTWIWWSDGFCPSVQQLVTQRAMVLKPSPASHDASALPGVIRELAAAIKTGKASGGALFVRSAAKATCYANRCPSIRAVVGTCGEAVEEGVTQLGANVLVIEYPHHGLKSMSAMVDRLIAQGPRAPGNVERDLTDLHRCG